jgi:hypothetical protein
MAEVYLSCNDTVLHLPGVTRSVKEEAQDVGQKAEVLLDVARAMTPHEKLGADRVTNPQPSHLTDIEVEPAPDQFTDWFVSLVAPAPSNPLAIEFGHDPSGYFAPERYGRLTKAPEGLYILHRAAGLI